MSKSTSFVLVVTSSLERSYSAYNFIKTIVEASDNDCSNQELSSPLFTKHSAVDVHTVFFYQQGVSCSNGLIDLPSNESNIQHQWRALAQKYNLRFIVCASSALRRGIPSSALLPEFKFGSIAQLVEACIEADKVVQL